MKRLLVLMMCAMLAVPSVGMNVSATEQTPDEVSIQSAGILNDYLKNKGYEKKEFDAACQILKEVAGELGLSFNENTNRLEDIPDEPTTYDTVDGVTECVKNIKEKIDNCKKKEPVKETPKEPEKIDVNIPSINTHTSSSPLNSKTISLFLSLPFFGCINVKSTLIPKW